MREEWLEGNAHSRSLVRLRSGQALGGIGSSCPDSFLESTVIVSEVTFVYWRVGGQGSQELLHCITEARFPTINGFIVWNRVNLRENRVGFG